MVEVRTEPTDPFARFFDLALFGDLVSLHLAGREGVDPGPAPRAGRDRARLAAGGAPAERLDAVEARVVGSLTRSS